MRLKAHAASTLLFIVVLIAAGCSLLDQSGEEDTQVDDSVGDEGTLIIEARTEPSGQAGSFQFTGVPTGTISADSTLVVSDLSPGTYTSTQIDPAPEYDLTAVDCDDNASATASSGDAQTRTAVFNLDPGETIRCTFINARRGSLVIASQTAPDGVGGSFQFTGVPSGTIPANGTLVVANLTPGTYTSTQVDPVPDFDVTAVDCDDGASPTASSGDAQTRTAVFNLDPGEMITCTYTNTRRGSVVVAGRTVPDSAGAAFQFTGVPTGTISGNGTLVAANLTPGTYTSTQVDPAPDFDLTAVDCDDGSSATASSGDAQTRTAVFNLDPGEMVICTFVNTQASATMTPTVTSGGGTTGGTTTDDSASDPGSPATGTNPFENPDDMLDDFPLPEQLPPEAGTFAAPKAGPWSVTHFAGQMDCGTFIQPIPASPPESGTLEVLDGGQTLIGTGLQDAQGVSITLNADPQINGRYTGAVQGLQQGVPVTINYFWQVVTDEYMIGFLTASVTSQGITCRLYRPFEMIYAG